MCIRDSLLFVSGELHQSSVSSFKPSKCPYEDNDVDRANGNFRMSDKPKKTEKEACAKECRKAGVENCPEVSGSGSSQPTAFKVENCIEVILQRYCFFVPRNSLYCTWIQASRGDYFK